MQYFYAIYNTYSLNKFMSITNDNIMNNDRTHSVQWIRNRPNVLLLRIQCITIYLYLTCISCIFCRWRQLFAYKMAIHSYDTEKPVTSKRYNVSKNRKKRLPDENIVFNLSSSWAFYDFPVRQSSRHKFCGHTNTY